MATTTIVPRQRRARSHEAHARGRAAPTPHRPVDESPPDLRVLVVGAGITPLGMPRVATLPSRHRDADGTSTAFDPVPLTDVARAKLPPVDAVLLLAAGDHAATIATLRLVRRRLGDTSVVVLASEHAPDASRETLRCAVDDYLACDDVDPATVTCAVRDAIERRSLSNTASTRRLSDPPKH